MPFGGEQTMPVCGSCGKSVANSDITCPHCGVLLAAYASPVGSGAATDYAPPPAPPAAEIPAVDLRVPPPSETPVVTNPEEVAEEAISTAPRPLFDTNLTVEAIAKAAEGDHDEDLVTIKDQDIQTKTVEFDVPDYAKPPTDAAPVPVVENVDPSIPVITSAPAEQPKPAVKPRKKGKPTPERSSEQWLYDQPVSQNNPRKRQREKAQETQTNANRDAGQTEDYLRRLHAEAGYDASQAVLTQPVPGTEKRSTPAQRSWRDRAGMEQRSVPGASASQRGIHLGCLGVYSFIILIMWLATLGTIITGNFNAFLVISTLALTWSYRQVAKFIARIGQQ